MRVLGIESSCDETGVAVYDSRDGLIAQALYSQIDMHAQYGGVVPELASRDHIRKIAPLTRQVIDEAGGASSIDGVAFTQGPGLVGALLVGASFGRSLAYTWGVPAIGVHHMEGHLLAPMLETNPPSFPFVALLVSGGHTLLVDVRAVGDYTVIGQSIDDAVGEAFDKTATLLGLSYPGGPALAKLAEQGDATRFKFSRPMTDRPGLDFSFSGLKTQVMTIANKHDDSPQTRADLARCFEQAVVDTLTIKCRRALQQTGHSTLIVAGGVGANLRLRAQLAQTAQTDGFTVSFPRPDLCTDNGAMIAYAGWLRLTAGQSAPQSITAKPRWPLNDLTTL